MRTIEEILRFENNFKKQNNFDYIIGIDEVGRGSLAGPVLSAALLLKKSFFDEVKNTQILIDDSKALTPKQREKAFKVLKNHSVFAVSFLSNKTIDKINIHRATLFVMRKSLLKLLLKLKITDEFFGFDEKKFCFIFDGRFIPDFEEKKEEFKNSKNFSFKALPHSDSNFLSVAAASIVAKVLRDKYMVHLDKTVNGYNFKSNKGYGTKEHIDAIKSIGASTFHRKSFLSKISKNEETIFDLKKI